MNNEISQAQVYLKKLEELRKQEEKIKKNNNYLPNKYDAKEVNMKISELTKKIEELQEKIANMQKLSNDNSNESNDQFFGENDVLQKLDEIILQVEQLILIRDNFEKYKNIHLEMENIILEISTSLSSARNECYAEIFSDSLENSESIDEFINGKCLSSEKLKVPFMVALLTHDPSEIYSEIINSSDVLNEEQKNIIRQYIESKKRRIEQNLVLSDTALISLLETNTGKNIIEQEHINSKILNEKDYYRRLANRLCKQIPVFGGNGLTTVLATNNSQEIINIFNNMASSGLLVEYVKLSQMQRNKLIDHIRYTESNLQKEIREETYKKNIAISQDGKGKKYDILRGYYDRHSLDGDIIKRFSEGSNFLRTIDDMQISNYPTSSIENFIGESFSSSKVSRDVKKQIIAIVLCNLELCYDMFQSYYMSGNGSISTYITLSNDLSNPIHLNQPLNNDNIQHLLGIPKSHNRDTMSLNLPLETLRFLDMDPNKFYSAREVLDKILDNKERIINECICGCYRGSDGMLYELLPWEKIILKTNAFIRGDFFKTTSLISTINPESYLIEPDEKINAVSINSTSFSDSAVYQSMPNITTGDIRSRLLSGEALVGGTNSLYQRNKDIILKGLIARLRKETDGVRISKIDGVVTNESFIGERVKTSNGSVLKTLNKSSYLLQGLDPTSGGVVIDVVNANGVRSTKSLDENVLLLEDLVLSFGDIQSVVDLSYEIIEQLKQVYGYTNGKNK